MAELPVVAEQDFSQVRPDPQLIFITGRAATCFLEINISHRKTASPMRHPVLMMLPAEASCYFGSP
jgi:hypothetical protein